MIDYTLTSGKFMEKPKYITNRELLLEIHKSKNSYCYYEKPEYSNYDAIVNDLSELTPEFIETVYNKKMAFAIKKNLDHPVLENLVFRLMTGEHIPEEPDLKKRKRNSKDTSMRTCFHPFKHYIMKNKTPVEVGRSHWKNDGFSDIHGKMTNRLAYMLMLLVERYSRRNNWRGYCVDTETEALTQRGWLAYDKINETDIILSYDASDKKLKWSKILSIFRDDYNGNMFHLTVSGMDALVTPGHKFITNNGMKKVEFLSDNDELVLMATTEITDFDFESHGIFTKDRSVYVDYVDFHGADQTVREPTVPYKGKVWCPETEYGTFMARRNGTIWLSHNTYNEDMRSHALLQLSEVALYFNESKSDTPNPFAFYTTVIKNSFTRILNNEKKVQHIRDDLLIMNDKSPSYTRQIEHEMEQKSEENKEISPEPSGSPAIVEKVVQKKRGRKPKAQAV